MRRTGVVIDARYQEHDTGAGHPERPARIAALERALKHPELHEFKRIEPRPASSDELARAHTAAHIGRVAATAGQPFFAFDGDTPTSARSWDTARLAAGGVLELVDAIMTGQVANGFALVRPPGHHAGPDRAMGFCLLNNVAIAARYLMARHGIERVAIIDWDVHHGNGTQDAFAADPSVLYVSTHQYPHYPGTGALHDVGRDAGEGFTVNLPLPSGCGDAEYVAVFDRLVEPICRQFDPRFVLVSAGFDAHRRDPLADMLVTERGFAAMARSVLRIAADHCQGRCAAMLEGGYDLDALTGSVLAVLAEMAGDGGAEPAPATAAAAQLVDLLGEVHRRHWDLGG